MTAMRSTPPCSTSTSIRRLPASMAFSTSSLTTLAGRSMTSPAAILLTRSGGRTAMELMRFPIKSYTISSVEEHVIQRYKSPEGAKSYNTKYDDELHKRLNNKV